MLLDRHERNNPRLTHGHLQSTLGSQSTHRASLGTSVTREETQRPDFSWFLQYYILQKNDGLVMYLTSVGG